MQAQVVTPTNQDCLGAIVLCNNIYNQTNSFSGTGNVANEINGSTSCLASGEKNDVWYTFKVNNTGNLNFVITPNNNTDDYDWALFNLTNGTCAQIYTSPSLLVSCNYSATVGPTGAVVGPNLSSQGAGGTPFNALIPATVGQVFYLTIGNFSGTQSGYTLVLDSSVDISCDTLNVGIKKDELRTNKFISVNPNPVENSFYINNDLAISDNAMFILYDTFGKEVLSRNLCGSIKTLLVNDIDLFNGIYYYSTMQSNKVIDRGKIAVVKGN